jgi:DNA-binding NarL/FixJ family response regulator
MSIRIVIADDHQIVRSGIKAELDQQKNFEIVGEATSGDMALEMVLKLVPDILLLDIMMPGMKTFEVIRRIHQNKKSVRIMILTAHGDRGTISGLIHLGVDGFLLKDEDPSVLPDAIRKISCGQKWLSSKVIDYLMENAQASTHQSEQPVLTEKEINVLRLISEGLSTKEIVAALESKERTVEFHIKKIKTKLGVNTSAQAVAWAKDHGVL